jgi:Holliday junction resolvase RusA-like endonuclease
MSQTFTLPYPPSANRYWRNYGGRMVVSDEARNYKQDVSEIVSELQTRAVTGNVAVHILVYRPRKAGDLDNSLKILIDSLRGVAYVDDSQIVAIHAYRHEDKKNPRVVVTVEECK